MKIEEVKDPYCLWIETETGVLAIIGTVADICEHAGIKPMSYEDLEEYASEVARNENAELISIIEFLKRKQEKERAGKNITIL